jgi:hypothetical protein
MMTCTALLFAKKLSNTWEKSKKDGQSVGDRTFGWLVLEVDISTPIRRLPSAIAF